MGAERQVCACSISVLSDKVENLSLHTKLIFKPDVSLRVIKENGVKFRGFLIPWGYKTRLDKPPMNDTQKWGQTRWREEAPHQSTEPDNQRPTPLQAVALD